MRLVFLLLLVATPALFAEEDPGSKPGGRDAGASPADSDGKEKGAVPGREKAASPGKEEPAPPLEVAPITYSKPPKKAKKKNLFVLKPRALSYKFILERIRIDGAGVTGTWIKPEEQLGMDRERFLSPEINIQIHYDILGFMARLHLTFVDETLHGLSLLDRDVRLRHTLFPAGTVVGSEFTHRRASVRYCQEVYKSDSLDFAFLAGGEYVFFRNVITSPGLAREKDITETGFPILGTRGFYRPVAWGKVYASLSGFYWKAGKEGDLAGTLEFSAGLFLQLCRNWGFMLDFTVKWTALREGDVRLHYLEFGPGMILYACL
jgi:hypothetical protein